MYERSRHLVDCHIAGFTYYDGINVIKELEVGSRVSIRSEPENPYDPNAVVVYLGRTKLGYLSRAKNEFISDLLYFGHGDIVEAIISKRDLEADTEHQFRIVIKIKDNRKK